MSYHSTITDFSWTSTYQEKLDLTQNRLNQFEIDKDKDIIKAEKDFNIKHTHLNHIKDLLLDINTHRLWCTWFNDIQLISQPITN
ncbi:hypothetical protein CU097_001075, partial [Rhizopus azygosporus]